MQEVLAVADDAAAWTFLGVILRRRDPVAAENALRHAIDLDSRDADARFHLGNLYREQQRFAAAIAEYEKALLLTPGHPSLLNNLALALEGTGNVERAITILQGAVEQPAAPSPSARQPRASALSRPALRRGGRAVRALPAAVPGG